MKTSKIAMVLFTLLIAGVMVSISGCDLDSGSDALPEPDYTVTNLAGRWTARVVDSNTENYMVLNANGTLVWNQFEEVGQPYTSFTGTWTLNTTDKKIGITLQNVASGSATESFLIQWTGSIVRLANEGNLQRWYSSDAPVNNTEEE